MIRFYVFGWWRFISRLRNMITVRMILVLMSVHWLRGIRCLMVIILLISICWLVWCLGLMVAYGFVMTRYIRWLMRFRVDCWCWSMISWSLNMWSLFSWMRWVCRDRRVWYFFCLVWSIMHRFWIVWLRLIVI